MGTKISELTSASSVSGSDVLPIVQGGVTKKATFTQVGAAIGASDWPVTTITGSSATLSAESQIVDVDTSSVAAPGTLSLTLPTPAAGRFFLVRKIVGASDKTITLIRNATEKIDEVAASRLLTGSDAEVDPAVFGGFPFVAWLVWSDGTDWRTLPIGTIVRNRLAPSAPVDTTHSFASEVGGYLPGSTWYDSAARRLYLAMTIPSLGNVSWHRVDAVDPLVINGHATLPSKDRSAFVTTASGAVDLTLPGPTGTNAGRQYAITKTNTGTNKIRLVRSGAEKINGVAANFDLPGSDSADYGRWHVSSDGTDWWVAGGAGLV